MDGLGWAIARSVVEHISAFWSLALEFFHGINALASTAPGLFTIIIVAILVAWLCNRHLGGILTFLRHDREAGRRHRERLARITNAAQRYRANDGDQKAQGKRKARKERAEGRD
jgi:hypothetical protein